MLMKRLLFMLCLLLSCSSLIADDATIVLDMRDGLSESRIRCIKQMPDGRIAIATTTTIDIFDGTTRHSFRLDPKKAYPLPDYNKPRSMRFDAEGRIWLRYLRTLSVIDVRQGQQVNDVEKLMQKEGLTAETITAWPTDSVPDDYGTDVSTVERDNFGGLWIGTLEQGICYKNTARLQFTMLPSRFPYADSPAYRSPRASQFSSQHTPSITNCTLDDRRDYLYVGILDGLLIVNTEDSVVARITTAYGLASNNIMSLLRDTLGNVWAANAKGLSRISVLGRDSFQIVNYGRLDGIELQGLEFSPNKMHLERDGSILIGYGGGCVRFRPDSVARVPRFAYNCPSDIPLFSEDTPLVNNMEKKESSHLLTYVFLVISLILAGLLIGRERRYRKMCKAVVPSRFIKPATPDSQAPIETVADEIRQPKLPAADQEFIDKVHQLILDNLSEEDFSIQSLSEQMAMDRTLLYRRMQAITGIAPSTYLKDLRIKEACRLLKESRLSISEIAYKTGFSSAKYFATVFKDYTGMTPKEYRSDK